MSIPSRVEEMPPFSTKETNLPLLEDPIITVLKEIALQEDNYSL